MRIDSGPLRNPAQPDLVPEATQAPPDTRRAPWAAPVRAVAGIHNLLTDIGQRMSPVVGKADFDFGRLDVFL